MRKRFRLPCVHEITRGRRGSIRMLLVGLNTVKIVYKSMTRKHGESNLKNTSVICLVLAFGVSCATPVKLAGKAAWSAVKLGTGLTWKIVTGIGKIGAKEALHAVDLTADVSMTMLARQESQALVKAFWDYMRGGTFVSAYGLLSDSLKKNFRKRDFLDYAGDWAPGIAGVEVLDADVRQFHVEIPARLHVNKEGAAADVRVVIYVSKIRDRWRITGWEGMPDR